MASPVDTHVLPINDLRAHTETRDCWCGPRVEFIEDFLTAATSVLVVHHSADGRELVEQHGIN